jgi:hypothetical protein
MAPVSGLGTSHASVFAWVMVDCLIRRDYVTIEEIHYCGRWQL